MPAKTSTSIISLREFIQSTRDSGYRSTASALSELVDNAIQANASKVAVRIERDDEDRAGFVVSVSDNGCGMDPFTLRQALRFGGSTRFGDRSGLGRYGMGLPNASLSQARRVEVVTWQSPSSRTRKTVSTTYGSYLDVDEISKGHLDEVPRPRKATRPTSALSTRSGTIVRWTNCDRLDARRASTLERRTAQALGRKFRYFLWKGLKLSVNGRMIRPVDPLLVNEECDYHGARFFGEDLRYRIKVPETGSIGVVSIRFAELPVRKWHQLPNDEKRKRGITNGSGVSVMRAGREVDHGWFFMGTKRRENYDDWWRCEIHFEPALDEAFGLSHTKQQVRPTEYLSQAIAADVESTGRALNSRARKAYRDVKSAHRFQEAEGVASGCDSRLLALPSRPSQAASTLMRELKKRFPDLAKRQSREGTTYRIMEGQVAETAFFSYARDQSQLVLIVNPDHPFYQHVYRPLCDSEDAQEKRLRVQLELLLLSAARTEAMQTGATAQRLVAEQRRAWSDTLATFLNA